MIGKVAGQVFFHNVFYGERRDALCFSLCGGSCLGRFLAKSFSQSGG
ncbi:hypothetical protein [Bartonella tribocorum]|nr:hypothetical protein [Bartonella tribocorum]